MILGKCIPWQMWWYLQMILWVVSSQQETHVAWHSLFMHMKHHFRICLHMTEKHTQCHPQPTLLHVYQWKYLASSVFMNTVINLGPSLNKSFCIYKWYTEPVTITLYSIMKTSAFTHKTCKLAETCLNFWEVTTENLRRNGYRSQKYA